MKSKHLLLTLLMALLVPWAAQAQETLTVCNGTTTDEYVPVYGYYVDNQGTTSEFIIPADSLEVMEGGTISKLTFYISGSPASWGNPTIQLYLGEVEGTTLSGVNGPTNFTVVKTMVWSNQQSTIEVEFDEPYTYGGGNLLIGTYVQSKGGYKHTYFFGVSAPSGSGYCHYSSYNDSRSFLPKTTFTYEPAQSGGDVCEKPATLVAEDVTGNSATLTWTGGSGTYNVELKGGAYSDWTEVLSNTNLTTTQLTLQATTSYQARVQSVCDGTTPTSGWKTVNFTTPCDVNTIDATHQWSEGFESYNQGTGSGVAVTEIQCWERVLVNSSTNSPFVYRNYQSAASTGLASLELKTGTSAVMVALPEFSAPIQSLNVAFNYNCTATTYTYTAELGYITDVADATTFVKLFDIPTPVTRGNHSTFSQDLYEAAAAANAPQGSRVAIRFASSYQYTTYPPSWNFDDFVVSYVSDCHKPTGLAITDGSTTAYGATATWTGTNDSYKVMIGQENLLLNANFEDNAIPAALTNSTSYPWTVMAGGANGSDYCIVPENHGVNSSDSDLTFEVTLDNPATVSFWAKISSENSDYGRFLIDGTQKLSISGTSSYTTWTKYEYELTAGSHTLIWRYHKDVSVHSGSDYFYVDDIIVSAGVASWTEYTTNALTYTFENLTPNRTYQVKVKGVCGNEETQATTPVSFTTLPSCFAPTGLAMVAGYPTAHDASFTWDYQTGEVFQFALVPGHVTDPAEVNFNTTWNAGENFPMWNTLSADTDWSFFLRKNCDGDFSDPVYVYFHTLEACPAPTGFAVMPNSITAHTANLTWQGTSNSYQVAYRTTAYVDGIEEGFSSNPAGWENKTGLLSDIMAGEEFGTSTQWVFGTNNGVFDNHARINIYGDSRYGWLITPEMTLPQGATFSFDLALTAFSGTGAASGTCDDDRFIVLVYADNAWHILREWNNADGSQYVYNNIPTAGMTVNDIDISAYVGKTVKFAFYGESTTSNNGDNNMHIDNVTIGTPVPAGEWQYASNITEETVTLQGLLAERKYEATLQGDCGNEGSSTVVGPITFTTAIACPAPTALTHANVKSTQVDLSWTNGGAEDWVLAYKKTNDENFTEVNLGTNDVTIEGTTVTYTLTGLDETTDYTVKVRDNCEASIPGDGMSAWTATTSFTTMAACAVDNVTVNNIGHYTATVNWDGESNKGFTVKYRTAAGIDGIEEGFSANPNGWLFRNGALNADGTATLSGNSSWTRGTRNDVFDTHIYMNMYNTKNYWLITPSMEIKDGDALSLDIAYTPYTTGDPLATGCTTHRFVVLISTDNMEHWTILREWNNAGTGTDVLDNVSQTGQTVSGIDLSAYAGEGRYIAFFGHSETTDYDNNFHFDNVTIGTPVEAGSWQENETNESPYIISGLEPGTKYDLKVAPICDETLVSEIQQFTTVSANEKWFVTEGNWGTAANWEPAGVPTISQNVTLKTNATIESGCIAEAKSIAGTTGSNAKTLTIEDGGKLKHTNTGVVATVKKNIAGYENYTGDKNGGYYLIANPITSNYAPTEANGFLSGNYDLYSWSYDAYDGNEWRNYEANTFTSLSSGAYGYLYANETGTDLTYTGTINAYTSYKYRSASTASNPDNYDFPSWYLLGNPYLYDAYLADYSSNGTALPYIKMNADGDGFEAVAAGTPIEPMQGFFYQGVTVESSAYVVTYEPTVQDEGKLNMNLRKGNKQLDNAILVFGESQSLGKMSFRANSTKLYMPVDNKDYAIVSTESNVGEMPVSFKAENNGTYTLSFSSKEVSFSYLHLIDNMTGNDVDLLKTPSYTFDATTTDYAQRFRLVFATGSSVNNDNFGFVNAMGNLCIFGIEGEATLQVIDVTGRVISSNQFSGSYESKLNVAPGVYMLRLINGNDVKVQKIVME